MVPGRFSWFLVGFHGFRLVFMVSGRFSWFFYGSRSVIMVFHGLGWFFMVPGRFSWFSMVPGWFYVVPGSRLVFLQIVPARTVSWPDDPV